MSEPYLRPDAWLTRQLGKPELSSGRRNRRVPLEEIAIAEKLAARTIFADVKIPVTDVASADAAQRMGFSLIDTNLRFAMPLSEMCRTPVVRAASCSATPDMADAIGEIAARSFFDDRFHRDPAIPKTAADELKRRWATNFFAGERGDWMVVTCVGDRPVGSSNCCAFRMVDFSSISSLSRLATKPRPSARHDRVRLRQLRLHRPGCGRHGDCQYTVSKSLREHGLPALRCPVCISPSRRGMLIGPVTSIGRS